MSAYAFYSLVSWDMQKTSCLLKNLKLKYRKISNITLAAFYRTYLYHIFIHLSGIETSESNFVSSYSKLMVLKTV